MKYTLDKTGLINIAKVLGWTTLSAIVASLIVVVENLEVDPQYLFLVSIASTVLYTVKEFVRERN